MIDIMRLICSTACLESIYCNFESSSSRARSNYFILGRELITIAIVEGFCNFLDESFNCREYIFFFFIGAPRDKVSFFEADETLNLLFRF